MSTVLVVDEDSAILTLCNHLLTRSAVEVLRAGEAYEAIEVSSHYCGPIDLLLSDTLEKCSFTGAQLASTRLLSRPAISFLLMSGCPSDEANFNRMAPYLETVSPGGAGIKGSRRRCCHACTLTPSGHFRISG